jgi:phosphate transport system protein
MALEHIVKSFDTDLQTFQNMISRMGEMAEQELTAALAAFAHHDSVKAAQAATADKAIDAMQLDIDSLAMRIIALRQPMAADLRLIVAGIRMVNDFERIGDYAKNIANHAVTLSRTNPIGVEAKVSRLGQAVEEMLDDVITAFASRDTEKAAWIRAEDEQIDIAYTALFRELLILNAQDGRKATACTHLTFVARSLERIGDHITNIAEDVVFIDDGKRLPNDRTKADGSVFVTLEGE